MDNQPPFDRGILLPIGVGIISLIGICVILVVGRMTALRASVQELPTATSFKYALVGTEPAITTIIPETIEFASPAPTEAPAIFITSTPASISTPILLTPNITNALTNIVLRTNTSTLTPLTPGSPAPNTNTPTRTPITASTAPLNSGTYDDLDNHLVYSGDWTTQSAVSGAYQNTLHVSGTLGNSVSFRFIGQELRVFFQAGPSLGVIRLNLDGTNYDLDESAVNTPEWVLPSVTNGTHTVTIIHLSGGSINLDEIIIPDVPVTPKKTATATP